MLVPNKHAASSGYRFGFQGQEMDNELKGEGNSVNYEFRMHDPRVGRFFATDPLEKKYPFYSPYQFSSNSPIFTVELEGLESSSLVNETEKKKMEKEGGKVRTWITLRLMDLLDISYNAGEVLNGRPPVKYPIADPNFASKSLAGEKRVFNETFSVMGTWELAKYGIGGVDDEIDFSFKNSFSSIKSSFKGFSFSLPKIMKNNFSVKQLANLTVDDFRLSMFGSRAWGRVNGEQIAFYTNTAEKGLQMEINIPKQLQGLGYGAKFFAEAVKESEADLFTATWVKSPIYESGSSVNLTKYQSALKNGATAEEAAFKTWSGQQARIHGFKNVTVKEIENGIEATFHK
jgi:RHS repeat-associated protein